MASTADDKYAVPGGCLIMLMIMGFIVWTFAGCLKREDPVQRSEADYADAMDRLRSPSVYVAVSRFIERRGYACPIIREIRPADRVAAADIVNTNRAVDLLVTCDADGPVTVYEVKMSRDNRFGSVRPYTQ